MDIDQQTVAALERQVGDQALSPLFAKLAYLYLESGRPKDALRICDAGLANFPFYSTGHLIKGKTLLQLGMNGEARREFEFVKGWLPTNPTVTKLLESVPQSDDLLLETPPADDAADQSSMAAETSAEPAGNDFFTAVTSDPVPVSADDAEPTVSEESANVFGLPSEAPPTGSSAMDAFGQAGTESSLHGDFETYALQKRGELGESNVTTLEEYLSSPQVEAEEPVGSSPEDSPFGGEDPLAAAGFGAAEDGTSEAPVTAADEQPAEQAVVDEDPFAAAGFGTQDETTPGTEETENPPPFAGFGEVEAPPEAGEEPVQTDEPSGMDAFGFGGETAESAEPESVPEEEPAASGGMDGFGGVERTPQAADEPSADEVPQAGTEASDIFAGFVGPDVGSASEESSASAAFEGEATDEPSFPDFSGLSDADPSAPEETETAVPEEASAEPDGFSGPPAEEPAAPAPREDKIGEFAEKLQEAKKITPVIDLSAQFTSTASNADEVATDAGFVTPTLAEIYAKQGWYDDAINAYKNLAKSRPAEKEKFEARVKELEEEKSKAE